MAFVNESRTTELVQFIDVAIRIELEDFDVCMCGVRE